MWTGDYLGRGSPYPSWTLCSCSALAPSSLRRHLPCGLLSRFSRFPGAKGTWAEVEHEPGRALDGEPLHGLPLLKGGKVAAVLQALEELRLRQWQALALVVAEALHLGVDTRPSSR